MPREGEPFTAGDADGGGVDIEGRAHLIGYALGAFPSALASAFGGSGWK